MTTAPLTPGMASRMPWSAEPASGGGNRALSIFDPDLQPDRAFVSELRSQGARVSVHHDAFNVMIEMATQPPSLLVISSAAWGAEAVRLIEVARDRFELPVALAMTRTDDPEDFATAILAGLSPLLERPYRLDPLLAALRQTATPQQAETLLIVGDLHLDTTALSAHFRGRRVELSAKEFAALWILGKRCGHGVTPLELSAAVWPDRGTTLASTRTLIRRLRDRLREADVAVQVRTVRGIGYRLGGCGAEDCELSSAE